MSLRALTLLLTGPLLAGLLACSTSDIGGLSGLGGKKKKVDRGDGETEGEDGGETDAVGTDENGNAKYTKTIDNSGANFQVKDVALLRSSIGSCMGDGMLAIAADMLLPTNLNAPQADLPDAKIRFLLPSQYVAGDDILEKEKRNLVDTSTGARTGIAADSLTDTYLRSLETIANVVAHNCTPDKPECQCATKDQAREMLTRCLPGLDPETKEMDEAAEMMGLVCADNGPKGMRKAIASMLSSYAFAASR